MSSEQLMCRPEKTAEHKIRILNSKGLYVEQIILTIAVVK